jgi:hypothetical protein
MYGLPRSNQLRSRAYGTSCINVDADFTGLTLRASGWIIRGLERMLTHGNVVEVTMKFCAIGHIGNLDAVREVPASEH